MIKAVIFDMDGLIADTEILESKALKQLLKDYNKNPHYQDNGLIHSIGLAGTDMWNNLIKQYAINEDISLLRKRKRIIFEQLVKKELKPFDGLFTLLKIIKKHHIKLALASSRFVDHIYLILDKLQVTDYFSVIVGPSETRRHKPYPDIYLEAAKQLGVLPENCLALEDTEAGILSANTAGMKVIAIPNEYTREHDFSKADNVVNSLKSVTIEMINSL